MNLRSGVYSLHKAGSAIEDNEDKYALPLVGDAGNGTTKFVCALSDGATEMSYSALWAELIATGFCESKGSIDEFERILPDIRKQWITRTSKPDLPWYAEQKLALGAFATLLGLKIEESDNSEELVFTSYAVGDTCLFHIRNAALIASFPATNHHQLLNRPLLLPSRYDSRDNLADMVKVETAGFMKGDRLILATDAVSGWIFSEVERGGAPFIELDRVIRSELEFAAWISALRGEAKIKNDDCTIIWIDSEYP